MKQTIITNIVLFLLLIASSVSAQTHEDFPEILPTYDIGTACAETGYVKVLAYVSDHNNLRFQLLSKELDENKHFIQFKQSPLQSVPEFHLKIHTLHFYQAMIIAYNTSGDIHAVSYMAAIVASRFMNSEVPTNPLPAPIVQTKKSRSGGLEMISTIDYSKFDLELIEINAEIQYNSKKVENLDKSNFEVMENSRYQNIIKVVSDEGDFIKTADIVFVHDDSGSMSEERAAVKANIMSFVQRLQNEGINYRIALLPYGGGSSNTFCDSDGRVLHDGKFHDNNTDFENDLNQMQISGGSEQAFCAINQAISLLHWRESTQRFIILITDEHNNDCGVFQSQLLDKLKNTNTTCYCLYDTSCSNSSCTNSSADFDPLANQTNGKIYNIYAEFTDILNDISADIASKYLIQYKTDDPESITPREVQLKVSACNTTKTNTMHYTANPFIISRTPETIALSDSGQRQQRSLQIVIKMTQSNAALNAALYYKNESSNFQSIQMTSIGNDLYCAYIPESMVLPKSIQYYISASNGTTTKTLPTSDAHDNPFIIPVLPNMAPFITHQSVTTANVGNSVNIKGSVEDVTNRVARVELYYKEQGENVYDQLIDTPNSTQHTFNFSIPGDKVTCNGVAYYINALDDFGVRSEIGTADNPNLVEVPPCIPPGCQDIGNVKICAEKFQGIDANNYIASGSVCIGTTSNGEILGTGAALKLNTADKTVETVIGNTLDVLSVKRTQDTTDIDLIPLYYGSFKIDCNANPPKLTYKGGRSRLKLIKEILFSFPTSTGNNYLLIQDDAVHLKDVFTKVTEGMEASVEIGDIILSQTGNTTPIVKVSGKTLTNKRSINNLNWKLKNLSFEVDIANNQFNGSGEFTIPRMIESDRGGIPATFGFKESPLSLENIYGNLGFPKEWRQPLMIPSKHTLNFLVTNPDASDYQIVEISDSKSKKKLIGNCNIQLYDQDDIVKSINSLYSFSPINGDVRVTIHPGKKAKLTGKKIDFMGHYPLEDVTIKIGRKIKLTGKLTISEIAYAFSDGARTSPTGFLNGNVDLTLDIKNGDLYVESSKSSNSLTLTMPQSSEWIHGGKRVTGDFELDFEFSKTRIIKSQISKKYDHKFTELNIRLDLSNPDAPVVTIDNFEEKESGKTRKKGRSPRKKDEQFFINEAMDQLIVKYFSEEQYPEFDLTFPDGTTYHPSMSPPDVENVGYDIYFLANEGAHESYYAIQNPPQGKYTLSTPDNYTAIVGDHQWVLYGPNSPPEIIVNSPASNIVWNKTSDILISYTGLDVDDDAKISLYYADNNTGKDAVMIVAGISEEYSPKTFSWTIDDSVQSGSYYIIAKIEDEVNAPEYACSTGRIDIVSPWAPQTPANFMANSNSGVLSLSWAENPEADLIGYRVFLSDTPSDDTYQYNFDVGLVTGFEIEGLTNGKTYAVAINAINYSGLESVLSDPIEVIGTDIQGSPDLCLDTQNSMISSSTGKLEGTLTIQARIKNIAEHESFSARIACYYGQLSQSNLIESRLIAGVGANSYMDVLFEIDSDNIASIHDLQYFYINIVDVVLPELNDDNNLNIIVNTLPFVQEISLNAGLNLISLSNMPESTDISPILLSISDKINYVASYQNGFQRYYPNDLKNSTLADLLPGNGYYFDMKASASLTINGSIATCSRFLGNGWNLTGLTTRREIPLADALESIDGKYTRVWALENGEWQMYDPANPNPILSKLQTLKPGMGYFISISTPSTWTYGNAP